MFPASFSRDASTLVAWPVPAVPSRVRRARLRYLLRSAGLPTLADEVPAADPRTESKALAGLLAA